MSLTAGDVAEFLTGDPEDDEEVPLGELAVDVETDAVSDVRDVRERIEESFSIPPSSSLRSLVIRIGPVLSVDLDDDTPKAPPRSRW